MEHSSQMPAAEVVQISAERARELRSGYPPRAVDLHDPALLDEL